MSHKKLVALIIIIFILLACGYVLIFAEDTDKLSVLDTILIPLIGLATLLYGIRSATGVLIKRKEMEIQNNGNKNK